VNDAYDWSNPPAVTTKKMGKGVDEHGFFSEVEELKSNINTRQLFTVLLIENRKPGQIVFCGIANSLQW